MHVDHLAQVIDYGVRLVGDDHIALGSDLDGGPELPHEIHDISDYPQITIAMQNLGYGDRQIKNILGVNGLRVIRRVTNITYIRTWQGWLYLAGVMDLLHTKIVGWSAQPAIHRGLVLDAVLMAVRRRRPRGTLIHSDQGTQYGADARRRFCRSHGLEPSMSRKGNC